MADTIIKTLKKAWKVGGQEATEIELRPPTMADVCDAEKEASPLQPNSFNIQMACRVIVRAGSFTGPFAPGHFRAMRPAQFDEITQTLREAEALGEE
ncbi:phage tail assembly protein [Limnohabitans sp.]|uniref:phage tail assembly protein n=1 Tax=Limnohabitans sp. TaxID=1907725 RepID=UPI00286EE6DB|nr:phage tail assembly protein [Limnohabitans sp.]